MEGYATAFLSRNILQDKTHSEKPLFWRLDEFTPASPSSVSYLIGLPPLLLEIFPSLCCCWVRTQHWWVSFLPQLLSMYTVSGWNPHIFSFTSFPRYMTRPQFDYFISFPFPFHFLIYYTAYTVPASLLKLSSIKYRHWKASKWRCSLKWGWGRVPTQPILPQLFEYNYQPLGSGGDLTWMKNRWP